MADSPVLGPTPAERIPPFDWSAGINVSVARGANEGIGVSPVGCWFGAHAARDSAHSKTVAYNTNFGEIILYLHQRSCS